MYVYFTFIWPCIVTNFLIIKPTRCTNFPNLLRDETLHVSGSSSVHPQEFILCTLGTGVCHTSLKTAFEQEQDGTAVLSWSCSKAVHKPVWHIPLLSAQWINSWWWAEELPETWSVSCQSKSEKLVHLVVFIIKKRICVGLQFRTSCLYQVIGKPSLRRPFLSVAFLCGHYPAI